MPTIVQQVTRVAALLSLAAILPAQTSTSAISGVVSDPSGASVPAATVELKNVQTGIANAQRTTESGLFSFPALTPGEYSVEVKAQGFRTLRRSAIRLTVNTPVNLDLTLEIGEAAEVVNVDAQAELIETSSAAVGNVVTQKAIVDLPLNGRNPLALIVLEPGVMQRSNGGAGTGLHVNGSRDMSHNVTIDGIDANESSVNNPVNNVYRLNPDNVQEYKVTTSNATAEEGRNSGASVSIATRSGSNAFHGTFFEFFRNTALNASEFYANALGTPKPGIKLNQYGAEFSGPLKRNKAFFFFSWQDQKINFSQPVDQSYGTAPQLYTAEARAGIFRYWRPDPSNLMRMGGAVLDRTLPVLVDPATGQLAPGIRNCASGSDLNCVASYNFAQADPRGVGLDRTIAQFSAQRPLPNNFTSGDGLNTATYLWNPPVRVRGPSFMGRIDANLTTNQSVFGRYIHASNNTLGGDPNNGRPQLYPGLAPLGEVVRESRNLAVGHRWVVSPSVVNEFTAGFSRFGFLFTQGEANPAWPDVPSYGARAGTGSTNAFNNFDPGVLTTPRSYRVVTTPQILDNLSIVKGAHIIRTGFNFRFYRHNDQRGQPGGINVTPLITFSRTLRSVSIPRTDTPGMHPTDSNRLLGTMNDLLGIPSRITQTFLGDLGSDTFLPFRSGNVVNLWSMGHRLKQYNFYVQDEWKMTRTLTLNAGLRWELNPAPSESHGRVYVPNRPIDGSQGPVTFVKADRWYQRMNWGAVAPRLAVAWSPNQRTVIRAGYAMAFDTLSSFQVTAVAGRVPGMTVTCSAIPGGAVTAGCSPVPDVRIGQGFPSEIPLPSVKPSSFLTPPAQVLAAAPPMTVFDPALKVPTVHQFNLTVQRELGGGVVLQTGYVGRRGTRLFRAWDINQISADPILPSFVAMQRNLGIGCNPDGSGCPAGIRGEAIPLVTGNVVPASFVNSDQSKNDLRLNAAGNMAGRIEQTTLNAGLRPNPQFGTITYIDSGADSYYHSWQTTLRKRFSAGLLFTGAYTFGKSIDTQSVDPVASSSGGGLSATNARTPTDTRNWRGERGRSDFDRTHVASASFVYDLPFGRDRKSFVDALTGGWSLNGLYTFMTGEPFSIRSGVRTSNFSHESRADVIGNLPPIRMQERGSTAGPVLFGPEAICGASVTTNCLAIPAPGSNGAGRNLYTGPSYWNTDLSVIRRFRITEAVGLQFRAEMFNIFNHANFDNPRDSSNGSTSIQATQFGSVCCATVAPSSTQAIIQTGESARVIQLALKLTF